MLPGKNGGKLILIILCHSHSAQCTLTFPSRTLTGGRLVGVQCAAVKMKYSEMIVPPQSNVDSSLL